MFRPVKKRPLTIKLVALAYFLAPLLMPLQVFLYRRETRSSLADLSRGPSANSIIVMLTSVLVGYGVWRVRKWGFYLFIAHATAIIINNVYLFSTMDYYPFFLMLVSNLALLGLAGFFIWSNVRAPFFNPRIRWWEPKERVAARYHAVLGSGDDAIEGETLDFSETGAFIQCEHDALEIGSTRYPIRLDFGARGGRGDSSPLVDFEVSCTAEVVWKAPGDERIPRGVGVRLHGLTRSDRNILRQTIKQIKKAALAPPAPAKAVAR